VSIKGYTCARYLWVGSFYFMDRRLAMDTNTLISLASAVAALLSALYAASAARSAKRSANVAERQYEDTAAGVSAYLIDAYSWAGVDERNIIAIGCTLTNLASAQTSIVRTELLVHEYSSTGTPSCLILRPTVTDLLPGDNLERLSEPLNLPERGTISGWLTFHLPSTFSTKRTVDKYELQFITATGYRTSISTHLMRRVKYESNEN